MNIKKFLVGIVTVLLMFGVLTVPAFADSVSVNFESPTYTLGSISGQDGWSNAVNPAYDQGVVANTFGYIAFGGQSFRMSDAVTSGSFGDWVFAKPLTDAVGEIDSTDGSFSRGTLQRHFEMQFDIASTVPDAQQSGLRMSVSPDRGDGSRMSYLRFEDQADGIHVFFNDVTDAGPIGTVATFNDSDIATLTRTPHTIKLTMDTLDGPANDVVKVYIDGVLKKTGTSWEDYYRFDLEASAEQSPRIVKTVIFQSRTGLGSVTNPADSGKGFLVDNLSLLSGPATVKVTIDKFIGSSMATALSANNSAFPMSATWNAINIGAGTGSYTLSTVGFNSANPYEAVTSDMSTGADYTTNEVTGGPIVGADCTTGQPYALVGYTTGDTLVEAQGATPTTSVPNFTNIHGNKYVIVWNQVCQVAPTPSTTPAPIGPPTNKNQCKDNGWRIFNNPSFKNQGDCVSYVERHQKGDDDRDDDHDKEHGEKSASKAIGNIRMGNPRQRMFFEAFDYGSSNKDKGKVNYWNYDYPGVLHYTASVLCAQVSGKNARFMFQIPAGWPGLTGLYIVSAVHDGGTPGTNGDTYGHNSTSNLATALTWCESGVGFTPNPYPITGGNLVVHD